MNALHRIVSYLGRRFLDLSIKKKLLTTYVLASLLPILVIASITYSFSTYYLQKNVSGYTTRIVKQLNNNIERNLVYMDNLAIFLSYNEDLQTYIRSDPSMSLRQKYDMEYRIENFLINTAGFNPLISEIIVLSLKNKDLLRVSTAGNYTAERYPENEAWYTEILSDQNYRKILVLDDSTATKYYSISRKIVDRDSQDIIGIVLVKCDIDTVNEMIQDFDFGSVGFIEITDSRDRVIFASRNAPARIGPPEQKKESGDHAYKMLLGNERMLVSSNVSPFSGWAITCYIRIDAINRDIADMLIIVVLVSVFCLLSMLFIATLLSRALANPIQSLEEAVGQLKRGNFDVRIPVTRNDEIGKLSASFNEMTERIHTLITTVYLLEIKEKEAELKLLQAQIDPHFLYNTLESIRTLAVLNDDYDTSEIITALGKFLRLKVDSKARTIPLTRELEHAVSYFSLIQLKYRNIRLVLDVAPELLRYSTVPLVFQPIIENCLQHGFDGKNFAGIITIRGRRTEERLIIEIEDDGEGLDSEKAAALNRMIQSAEDQSGETGGIGLHNVNARLKLAFGEEYGISVAGRDGTGTTVSIQLPLLPA